MATIIKKGKYPTKNILKCNECGCEFMYYDSETTYETTTQDEESFLGGFGSYRWINCPQCNNKIIFDEQFTPYDSWIDNLTKWIKNFLERRIKSKK